MSDIPRTEPVFPHYEPPKPTPPPNPNAIPVAHPKFHSPLYKMMRMAFKPKTALLKSPFKAPKTRRSMPKTNKKTKYY